MELRLMRGKRDVFAQLLQKLTFAAAEAVPFPAGGNEYAEDPAFVQERRRHQRTQSRASQLLRERHLHFRNIRFIDQLPANATAQAVRIDGNMRLLCQRQLQRQWLTPYTHVNDFQLLACRVVVADAAEIET